MHNEEPPHLSGICVAECEMFLGRYVLKILLECTISPSFSQVRDIPRYASHLAYHPVQAEHSLRRITARIRSSLAHLAADVERLSYVIPLLLHMHLSS